MAFAILKRSRGGWLREEATGVGAALLSSALGGTAIVASRHTAAVGALMLGVIRFGVGFCRVSSRRRPAAGALATAAGPVCRDLATTQGASSQG
ncbi:hypothetical protein CHELA20_53477 [Hyphomicrobiales bacterium]|nr:hypothetical protein CHELA41_21451 [Hyphomicrobiales bacterium]CAH1684328.1 hypothetical protein CHELA20_53477 [Hyphomicrobiales bacterium]